MINLEDIKNKDLSPFKVPEGYFEGMENRVLTKAKKARTLRLARTLVATAAVLALAIIAPWQNDHTQDLDYLLANASNAQLYSMVEMIEVDLLDQ